MTVMIDSSVWIGYFNGIVSWETDTLDDLLGKDEVLVGDLILTEVLQGFRSDQDFRKAQELLQCFTIVSIVGRDNAIAAAKHYRTLRAQGVTVRKTIDVMIGTYCIRAGCLLLHADRDFDPMVKHLGLRSYQ